MKIKHKTEAPLKHRGVCGCGLCGVGEVKVKR